MTVLEVSVDCGADIADLVKQATIQALRIPRLFIFQRCQDVEQDQRPGKVTMFQTD